ncbi:coproporphyrinogen dehydrogenase HemZ [Acetonema longum]|uniref:Coproporphyrinogen III oxidase n=1 Tax=Acetonema longum DSM 6540 TaxID=1009370 RepID=F7NPM9_9FIRM|nr:coproporphyrinogen dehydrogenase HemZ [Acetonema longum]EGO61996.1 coproporphyrinogen III oxidase [Acetonema longum DSM 6540]
MKGSQTPWGILTGVRPGKIVQRMLDAEEILEPEIVERLQKDYAIRQDKAKLLAQIGLRHRQLLLPHGELKKKVSVYVGIPFCPTRCLYCSFPSYVLPQHRTDLELFLAALARDIAAAGDLLDSAGVRADTIYIGGGTPTSLGSGDFSQLLAMIQDRFANPSLREFTVEAGRPDTMDDDKLKAMKYYSVNRVSINPQTMQQKTLKHIGRMHSVQDIIDVFGKLRSMGFPVINMDLIAGLPGETEQDMADTLEQLARLDPDNFTVHALAIKKGSRLKELAGRYPLPGPADTEAMVYRAAQYAERMGMVPYYLYRQKYMTGNLENVGYTKPELESLYNIYSIEERQTIIGIGPAATTKFVAPNWRVENMYHAKDLKTYIATLPHYIRQREAGFRLWMSEPMVE